MTKSLRASAKVLFLSTPSVRRATITINDGFKAVVFLSTPSVRRATMKSLSQGALTTISIHALREEGDTAGKSICKNLEYFYPRPP